jgi:biotin operon repressor
MKTRSLAERLDEKTPQAMLVNHFREHYNYNPAMAEALFKDAVFVRNLVSPVARDDGQVICRFPKSSEPAGKPLRHCEFIDVRISVHKPADAEFLQRHGSKALRQHRIQRICCEAWAQGAPATQEDLAVLLGCHRSTVIRDIAEMKAQGIDLVTRGDVTDQGRGVSHKHPIIRMYLLGWPPTEVAKRTGHTLESVEKYIDPFFRVAYLHADGKGVAAICRLTQLSQGLVQEYLALYQALASDPVFSEPLAKRLRFFAEGLLPLGKKGGRQ